MFRVRAPRLELGTSTLSGWRSNQLSYARSRPLASASNDETYPRCRLVCNSRAFFRSVAEKPALTARRSLG